MDTLPCAVQLLVADEPMLLNRAVDTATQQLTEQLDDATVERINPAEVDVLADLYTPSLFGGQRILVVSDAKKIPKQMQTQLLQMLEQPPGDVWVVLGASRTGNIRKVAGRIKKAGGRTDIKVPADWDDRGWIQLAAEELRRSGRDTTRDAAAAIAEHAGRDATTIVSLVRQLTQTVPAGQPIGRDHVAKVAGSYGSMGAFAIADALVERNAAQVLTTFRGAVAAGESPHKIMGALTYRMRQLLQAAAGGTHKDLSTSPGRHRMLVRQADGFGHQQLTQALSTLADVDVAIKTEALDAATQVEVALLDICGVATRP